MTLDDDYPALTALLDRHFRALGGGGDDAAVDAFLAASDERERAAVVDELRALAASQHDPLELRQYLAQHRLDMLPEEGAEAWLAWLAERIELAWS